MPAKVNPTLVQQAFQGYGDGTQTGSTALASQDINWSRLVGEIFHVRVRIAQTDGTANSSLAKAFKLKFSRNAGVYEDVGSLGSAVAARYRDSVSITEGEVISTGSFRLVGGSGTAIAGECRESAAGGTITFVSGATSFVEILWVVELNPDVAAADDTFAFRAYETGDIALNSYTQTPTVTTLKAAKVDSVSISPNFGTYGDTFTANVTTSGTATVSVSYQWLKDGVEISGATGQTYTP